MATTRSVRVLAAGFTASLALVAASPAAAQDPAEDVPGIIEGSAFGASIELGGDSILAPTPVVVLPADGTRQEEETVDISVPGLLDAGILRAETEGTQETGESTATGEVADVEVLPTPLNVAPSLLSADVISATCTATPDGNTGSATLTDARLSNGTTLDVTPGPDTEITVPGIAEIFLNEQTDNGDGSLTVNAIRIVLLPNALTGNNGAEIILGSATCGPNSAAVPINAIPTAGLPLAAGIVIAFVAGVVVMRRREMGPFAA
jgi:hypothetical protein